MSIFGRFLKKKEKNTAFSEQETSAPLPSRAQRVRLKPLHHAFLSLIGGKEEELVNISVTGLAARNTGKISWPDLNKIFQASLRLGDKVFPVQLNVIHSSNGILGCSFESPSGELQPAIQKYFSVELSALAMTRVNQEVVQAVEDGAPYWFLGENNCELYFVENGDKKIIRFHLSFFGNFLEMPVGGGLRYGKITADAGRSKPGLKGSNMVKWDSSGSREIIPSVLEYLEHIPDLNQNHRSQLISFLRS